MARKISDRMSFEAINFLFPGMAEKSVEYQTLKTFIEEEFGRIQTAVLYYRNDRFVKLLNKFGLDVGAKEVIVTPKSVRATDRYWVEPHIIYQR